MDPSTNQLASRTTNLFLVCWMISLEPTPSDQAMRCFLFPPKRRPHSYRSDCDMDHPSANGDSSVARFRRLKETVQER